MNKPSPATIIDESGKGFWAGLYLELPSLGCDGHWKEPNAWRLFYVTVDATTGEVKEGFVRAVSARDRSEAVISLARQYPGCTLILHDVVPPLSREKVVEIECLNTKMLNHQSSIINRQSEPLGSGPGRDDDPYVPFNRKRGVPVGV
jgi:hypothetical protein